MKRNYIEYVKLAIIASLFRIEKTCSKFVILFST